MSIQISDKMHRAFVIGCYIESNDSQEWYSVKAKIYHIKSVYLNPIMIIAGDYNTLFQKMKIYAGKCNYKSTEFQITSEQHEGDIIQLSQIDNIFTTNQLSHQAAKKVSFSDH